MRFSATCYGSSFSVHNRSKTRIAISNPRNVAPFANGDLLAGKQVPAEKARPSPNQCRAKPTCKGPYTFCPPNSAYAIQGGLVFLSSRRGEPIGLHPRLDHIYGVYNCPELQSASELRILNAVWETNSIAS